MSLVLRNCREGPLKGPIPCIMGVAVHKGAEETQCIHRDPVYQQEGGADSGRRYFLWSDI